MGHSWRFYRSGGIDQVQLESSDDLRNLSSLDKKLWMALACPVSGLASDSTTLSLLDADSDGRVRAPDITAAVSALCTAVTEPADTFKGLTALPFRAFRSDTPEGRSLLASSRVILAALGRSNEDRITLADVSDPTAIFSDMPFTGDGVVPEFAAADPDTAALVRDILTTLGPIPDRSGKPGVNKEKLDKFFEACQQFIAWQEAAIQIGTLDAASSAQVAAALTAAGAKVEDFFTRVRMVTFDARGSDALNGPESFYSDFGRAVLKGSETEALPLSRVMPGAILHLDEGINPAWTDRIRDLKAAVAAVLGPRSTLSEADWHRVKAATVPYTQWIAARAGGEVESLGLDRIKTLLKNGKDGVQKLIEKDLEKAPEASAVAEVIRIVHLYCHLGVTLKNFVNFAQFYGRQEKAAFQAGTLYLDKRSCDLVVQVQDSGRHGSMAGLAGMYLAYLDCVRRSDNASITIAAAFTDGDSDNLIVGRNGIFFDRQGRDYDATITRLVENPISIRQAFWAPYKKLIRSIEAYMAKRAAEAEAKSDAAMEKAAEVAANLDKAKPESLKEPSKIDIGTVAALGVAVGGITAALGAIMSAVFGLGYYMPLGLLGIVLLISGPSMLIAALKLRLRNLGPLLDADGWAVNASARVNIPFGRSLTQLAVLPPGSVRDLSDPFQAEKSRWPTLLMILVVIAVAAGAYMMRPTDQSGTEPAPAPAAGAPAAP